jgi:hypothetical protein
MRRSLPFDDDVYIHEPVELDPEHTDDASEAIRSALRTLFELVQDCSAPGTVVAVLVVWMLEYEGRYIRGGDGTIGDIAKRLFLSSGTVRRAVAQIAEHPVLGQAFHYEVRR